MNGRIGLPLTLAWTPAPDSGRTLFIAFAYHGADRDQLTARGILARFDTPAIRDHRIVHRDHYANPRPLAYLLAMIDTAVHVLTPAAQSDIVLDNHIGEEPPADLSARFGRIERAAVAERHAWRSGLLASAADYQNVVLVYSDALGLGCEAGERMARRVATPLIINGRRRAFRLTRPVAKRLTLSRVLARTRVVERMLAWAVRPVAAGLAMIDQLRGRNER